DYFVGEADLIADPARPFVARIKAAFILLQVGMALGVAQGGIDSCLEVEPVLGHVNRFLHDRPDELTAELDEAVSATQRLARTAYDGST
ncbi:acyl-CoA dehydrogenase, partial [Paraburkholderia sp. RL18-085-BIA-A]